MIKTSIQHWVFIVLFHMWPVTSHFNDVTWFAQNREILNSHKGLFTVSDRDSDSDSNLLWVQCTSVDLFTVSDCFSDSDIAIAKSGMGVAPILAISDSLYILYKSLITHCEYKSLTLKVRENRWCDRYHPLWIDLKKDECQQTPCKAAIMINCAWNARNRVPNQYAIQ